ncbi:hypothetical protein RhiirB3_459338 [Rhizophagus irregularis]|nr:hypothetical protein RhiirB3_459338 [Rhizophagus irregularis]
MTCDEWGNENNSGWDEEFSLLNKKEAFEDKSFELTWSDNTHLEKKTWTISYWKNKKINIF